MFQQTTDRRAAAGPARGRLAVAPGAALAVVLAVVPAAPGGAAEPPAVNPFGRTRPARPDAVPGYLELSDGTIYAGQIYLTRDARLNALDEATGQRRELPLRAVRRIECAVRKEWMEKQWRFRESANKEKVYTGQAYPAREYVHRITLQDGRTMTGPLSALLYVKDYFTGKVRRVVLHKRDKGELGADLESLVYVRRVELGEAAMERGKQKKLEADRRSMKPPADR